MSNKQKLEEFITSYRTYEEVRSAAYNIDPLWRESTWTRSIRKSDKVVAVYKDKNLPNSPIVGYMPKTQNLTLKSRNLTTNFSRLDTLNDQLLEILKTIPVSWENQSRLLEVKNALKSKSDYLKQVIISKYENQN